MSSSFRQIKAFANGSTRVEFHTTSGAPGFTHFILINGARVRRSWAWVPVGQKINADYAAQVYTRWLAEQEPSAEASMAATEEPEWADHNIGNVEPW